MSSPELEKLLNDTFRNLAFFYRDTPLPKHLSGKYAVGQLLFEKAFTDCTWKAGGVQGNFRYLIASANGRDMSAFGGFAPDLGLILIPAGSYYKVLDVYTKDDKTQVLLLHVPVSGIDFFAQVTTDIENMVVTQARADFDKHYNAPPLPEHDEPEWKERVSFPIGMNDEGEFLSA